MNRPLLALTSCGGIVTGSPGTVEDAARSDARSTTSVSKPPATDAPSEALDAGTSSCAEALTGAACNEGETCQSAFYCDLLSRLTPANDVKYECRCVDGHWVCPPYANCPSGTSCGRDPATGLLACLPM